ncbi:CusA/CzcA family heavy metal efflux RND transporter [Hallella mizrahii]|uniref:Efflux RND transporter permease subunit n=1 Tax=Hallella mizrahii TaxID=2606637 RepID=A0A7K0KDT7_9BACT|nr:CusA/CzcA family heavy metal efflux RND transporter [Hallella mizrahii]MST84018.1 efflux RND transporter permease subunit [Hallella mizrahii]
MNKLIDFIIAFSLKRKYLILIVTLIVVIMGVVSFRRTPIDTFPDVTNTKVTIITQWPGRSAEEIEKFVTIPIEIAMNSVQKKTDIRSTTLFGLSVVTVCFDDHVDDEFARQQVYNLLHDADLPDGVDPDVQPLSGPTGEIYRYTLRSDKRSVRQLKTLQDWVVERKLRSVPGIADIVSFGGEVKTFEVSVNPNQLATYGVSALELYQAIANSNVNVGGDVIQRSSQAYVVHGIGLINNVREIGDIVVKNVGGTPILVRNLASVHESCQPRLGQVGRGTEDDVVEGIVVMRKGENTEEVIKSLKSKIAEIQHDDLPKDVKIVPFYDREDLVNLAVGTVMHNVVEGIILVTLVVLLFMKDWRTTVIVASVIPLALLFAFIALHVCDMSANLLSMGAIDFGIIIDGAVVMVEALFVALSAQARTIGMEAFNRRSHLGMVRQTARGKAKSVFFSKLIIITALLPIFTFQKVEGKMFSPLAYTLGFALLGALLFTLTLVPVLSSLLLKKDHHYRKAIALSLVGMTAGLTCFHLLGSEFLPEMNEGSVYARATLPQSVSLKQSVKLANEFRHILLSYPEVSQVMTQTGRPNDGTDATGFYNIELFVKLFPEKEWKTGRTKEQVVDDMNRRPSVYPGIDFNFSQPISDNVEEAVSGVKGAIVAKVYGKDLAESERLAWQVYHTMKPIRGITDLGVIRNMGQPELQIDIDEDRLARYGVKKDDVQSIIEMAIGGKAASQVYEAERKFNLVVRYEEPFRNNAEAIAKIKVPTDDGQMIPISELATIRSITGPLIIYRENHDRYCAVKFSVRDRDMGSAVDEACAKVAKAVKLPAGYKITWNGDFENQKRASTRLAQVVPISVLLIFVILYVLFGNARDAGLVLTNVPFAAVGGILILLLTHTNFSISAGIGFICLFGICIQNGVIMLMDIKHFLRHRYALPDAVTRGMHSRIRSVLMTAMMATLGLLPAALSHGIGSESQRPLATVIIGGLVGATLFTLFIFPLIIERIYTHVNMKKLR